MGVITGLVTIRTILASFQYCGHMQKRKCAQETITRIERFVFAFLGIPRILQSDNRKEFDNKVATYVAS